MLHVILFLYLFPFFAYSQSRTPHVQAHSHNDYEHEKPLWNAYQNGFTSVEADVHLIERKLLVSHARPKPDVSTLTQLYLAPLDSLIKQNDGTVYPNYNGVFYLMIDCKTEAVSTYRAIQNEVDHYARLKCTAKQCPVKIFISGNRAVDVMMKEGYQGIAIDGRPIDLEKGISKELMPIVSDHYANWSSWKGKTETRPEDLARIRDLAKRVHAEGKKLRLWAIPDNEMAWAALLDAGVDLISTDHLNELNAFLVKTGL